MDVIWFDGRDADNTIGKNSDQTFFVFDNNPKFVPVFMTAKFGKCSNIKNWDNAPAQGNTTVKQSTFLGERLFVLYVKNFGEVLNRYRNQVVPNLY